MSILKKDGDEIVILRTLVPKSFSLFIKKPANRLRRHPEDVWMIVSSQWGDSTMVFWRRADQRWAALEGDQIYMDYYSKPEKEERNVQSWSKLGLYGKTWSRIGNSVFTVCTCNTKWMYNINTPMWMIQHFATSWSNTIQYNKHKIHVEGKLQHPFFKQPKIISWSGGSCLFIKPLFPFMDAVFWMFDGQNRLIKHKAIS